MTIIPILLMVYVYDTPQELTQACAALGISEPTIACAVPTGNKCQMHIMKPQIGFAEDFYVIGHEFWHCPYPEFH